MNRVHECNCEHKCYLYPRAAPSGINNCLCPQLHSWTPKKNIMANICIKSGLLKVWQSGSTKRNVHTNLLNCLHYCLIKLKIDTKMLYFCPAEHLILVMFCFEKLYFPQLCKAHAFSDCQVCQFWKD